MIQIYKRGYLLIEAIIYLAISSFLFLLLFQLSVQTYEKYLYMRHYHSKLSSILLTMDLIIKDLQKSSQEIKNWKVIQNNLVIFSTANIDIGWILKNNKLYRIEGEYEKLNQSWKNKIESLVATNINKIEFQINMFDHFNIKKINDIIKIIKIKIEANISGKSFQLQKSVSPKRTILIL